MTGVISLLLTLVTQAIAMGPGDNIPSTNCSRVLGPFLFKKSQTRVTLATLPTKCAVFSNGLLEKEL